MVIRRTALDQLKSCNAEGKASLSITPAALSSRKHLPPYGLYENRITSGLLRRAQSSLVAGCAILGAF